MGGFLSLRVIVTVVVVCVCAMERERKGVCFSPLLFSIFFLQSVSSFVFYPFFISPPGRALSLIALLFSPMFA